MNPIYSLNNLTPAELKFTGEKAFRLGELKQAGFQVPDGFVISNLVFKSFMEENRLKDTVSELLKTENVTAFEEVQRKIVNSRMPPAIEAEVFDNFKHNNLDFAVVRSSASVEDSIKKSWAGAFNSYLGVSQNEVLKYIKKCWSSLYNRGNLKSMFQNQLFHKNPEITIDHFSMAVIVQEMIFADVSGVVFTAVPGNTNLMIIEAGFGFGSVVSGSGIHDKYWILKDSGEILKKDIREQKSLKTLEKGKVVEVAVPETDKKSQKLSDNLVKLISKAVCKIEKLYKLPQSIEFVINCGKLFFTQTRPLPQLGNDFNKGAR